MLPHICVGIFQIVLKFNFSRRIGESRIYFRFHSDLKEIMKRARKAAIVESSAGEEDSDDSDFGETLGAKLKRKKLEAESAGENIKPDGPSPLPKKARTVKS